MDVKKFNRRAESIRWAYEVQKRAPNMRRAQRAAHLISALENWLDNNSPTNVRTYNDHD
jgi:hypothetical protein